VDIVTLSGLISPSLNEMEEVVSLFEENNLTTPILIGGAATSRLHTALKLEPKYKNRVVHVTDASSTLPVVASLIGDTKEEYIKNTVENYHLISRAYHDTQSKKVRKTPDEARRNRKQVNYTPVPPKNPGREYLEIPVGKLEPLMDWSIFLNALRVKGTAYEDKSLREGKAVLNDWKERGILSRASIGIFPSKRDEDTLEVEGRKFPLVRNLGDTNESLADYIEEEDYIGGFVASVRAVEEDNIIHQLLANTLAEATSLYLQNYISENNWSVGIRPAIGYPCLPDHSLKGEVFEMVDGHKTGAALTENFAMSPGSTVCGLYLGNPQSEYINPTIILESQNKEVT